MSRDYRLYLDDILQAIGNIREYVEGMDAVRFASDRKTRDAVIRNLEIIGEASRNLPDEIKASATVIDWRKIMALRDILVHEYFGVSVSILWDLVQNKLDHLEAVCRQILNKAEEL